MDCEKPLFKAADLFCESEMDLNTIEKATTKILEAIGEDPQREGLLKTPSRVAQAYEEILAGYRINPEELINDAFFTVAYDELVIIFLIRKLSELARFPALSTCLHAACRFRNI